jgi:diguanylate cyclase (GGDEF)-like protein
MSNQDGLAALEALAIAIDVRDGAHSRHIPRMRLFATAVARALGMSENEVQGVDLAAILHDVGKLAVSDPILAKPGPLTPDELEKIRAHPKAGADIVSSVALPYPVAHFIMSHHERWDGKGYPAGLKGEEIPLGARILSAVDYFDGLMTERPYQKALTEDDAIELLQQEAGKGLDPTVVGTLIELLPALRQQEASAAGEDVPPERRSTNVFDAIALAHRETAALYGFARAMSTTLGVSDTMAMISARLMNLVPFECAALFLYDEESEMLRCRFATGIDADVIQQVAVPIGEGLTGSVARNRRPIFNARPSVDLEAAGLTLLSTTLQSALACPLLFNERLVGTLSVYHTDATFYHDDHRRLLEHVSEQAAGAIANSLLFELTQEDALTDPVTGLANPLFLSIYLARELTRAERRKAEVALLVMDFEHLRGINKMHGHAAGDRALGDVARVLRAAIRPCDIAVRSRGGEFIVVMPGCGADEAEQKRLELKKSVDEIYFEAAPGCQLKLTIKAGGAIFPHDGETQEALLTAADRRLQADRR